MESSNLIANKEIVHGYIVKNVNLSQLDYDVKIFEEGLVNSLFAIELMTFLEDTFDIKIRLEDLDMENFQSINAIADFVKNKMDGDSNA